jgi:hypothetical protein
MFSRALFAPVPNGGARRDAAPGTLKLCRRAGPVSAMLIFSSDEKDH